MRLFIRLVVLLSVAPAGLVHAGTLSGTYIGKGPSSAFMIQLVEGAGRTLTGRYVQATLPASGPPQQINSAVTGTYNGHTIVLIIKPTELLAGSMTVSGSVDDSSLRLTGGGYGASLNLNLARSDETEFQTAVALLDIRAQQIASEKAAADLQVRANGLTAKLEKFSAQVEGSKSKLIAASVEQRYRRATELMRAAHDRQRSITGDGQGSVARGQIDAAINQVANQSIQLHQEVASEWQNFNSSGNALMSESRSTIDKCKLVVASDAQTEFSTPEIKTSCAKLLAVAALLGPRADELRQVFAKTEIVWNKEERKQRGIVRAADYAVR